MKTTFCLKYEALVVYDTLPGHCAEYLLTITCAIIV